MIRLIANSFHKSCIGSCRSCGNSLCNAYSRLVIIVVSLLLDKLTPSLVQRIQMVSNVVNNILHSITALYRGIVQDTYKTK